MSLPRERKPLWRLILVGRVLAHLQRSVNGKVSDVGSVESGNRADLTGSDAFDEGCNTTQAGFRQWCAMHDAPFKL